MNETAAQFILGFFWAIFIGFSLDMLTFWPGKFGTFFKKISDKERKWYNENLVKDNKYLDERPSRYKGW